MPRVRDHDPRYCSSCQFGLALSKAAGATLGIFGSLLVVGIVVGALAFVGYSSFLFFVEHPGKFEEFGVIALFFVVLAVAVAIAAPIYQRLERWLENREHLRKQPPSL